MGVSERGTDALLSRLDPATLMGKAKQALTESLADGKNAMVHSIETRGTGREWQHPWGGRAGSMPGRDDTGEMKGAVEGPETVTDTGTRVTGYLGWAEGTPEYFRHQEYGFRNILTGTYVEEMRALRDATDQTTAELLPKLRKLGGVQ